MATTRRLVVALQVMLALQVAESRLRGTRGNVSAGQGAISQMLSVELLDRLRLVADKNGLVTAETFRESVYRPVQAQVADFVRALWKLSEVRELL